MKSFFTPRDCEKILDVSYRQLQYWDETDFIKPSYKSRDRYRLYTFADLFLIDIAVKLRKDGYSIQKLRKTISLMRELLSRVTHPLIELSFLIDEERILVFNGDVVMDQVTEETHYKFRVQNLRDQIDKFFEENADEDDLREAI